MDMGEEGVVQVREETDNLVPEVGQAVGLH